MIRLVILAVYTAAMLALGWLLWQIVPPLVGWLDATFGKLQVGVAMIVLWLAGFAYVYRAYRRHPDWSIGYQRQRSGKFLEPRHP